MSPEEFSKMIHGPSIPMWESAGFETKSEFFNHIFSRHFSGPSYWETTVLPAMQWSQFTARAVITGGSSLASAVLFTIADQLVALFDNATAQ